jgi:rhodanese-related sulfurtransferase
MRKAFLSLIISIVVLSACQSKANEITGEKVDVTGGSYTNVTSQQLNEMLKNKDFVFINVHIPFGGNISGTDLSIPYNELEQNISQLPADKNAKIVLYCRSGHMSAIAAEKLISLGYTNIWNLKGGMTDWEQAGYSLEK